MPPSNIFIPGMTLRREFGIELGSRLTLGYKIDTREYQQHGHAYREREYTQHQRHRDYRGNNRLGVVIHADDGRPQQMLSRRHEKIREERRAEYHKSKSPINRERQREVIDRQYLIVRKREETYRGIKKKPLAHRHRGIARYKPFEKGKINTETDLCQQAKQVAQGITRRDSPMRRRVTKNKYQSSRNAQHGTNDLLPSYGFSQEYGREYHRNDRWHGGDDGGIYRRGERQAIDEHALVEHDTKQCGKKQHDFIATRHMFVREKKRKNPKGETSPQHTIGRHGRSRYDGKSFFPYWGIQSPNNIGSQ